MQTHKPKSSSNCFNHKKERPQKHECRSKNNESTRKGSKFQGHCKNVQSMDIQFMRVDSRKIQTSNLKKKIIH